LGFGIYDFRFRIYDLGLANAIGDFGFLDWGNAFALLQVKNREYWRVAKFLWGFWKRVVERAAGGGFGVGRTSLAMKKWLPS
jgi:hypothetical protein